MQVLFPMCSHACIRGFQTTGVKESYYGGGWPPRIYSHFPLLPPISSLSASSSSYHPYTACPGETAVEDIMLCCGDPWESKTKGGEWGVKGETVKDRKGRSSRGNAGVLAIYTFPYIYFTTSFPLVFAPCSYQYSVQHKLPLFKSIFLWLVAATTILCVHLCTIFTAICNLTIHNMCSSQTNLAVSIIPHKT